MIVEFVKYIYYTFVKFDFDSAQQKLREREVALFTDRYQFYGTKTFLRNPN